MACGTGKTLTALFIHEKLRMHAEIERLARRLHAHADSAEAAGAVRPEQSDDLMACLYGLHALLELHFV